MRDGTRSFAKAFPAEEIDVVRLIHGISGSSLKKLESRERLTVTWCRETSSKIEISINGHFVDDRGTFGDSQRLGQSVDYALQDWNNLVADYDVGPGDKVEVSVMSWVEDTPTFGFSEEAYGSKYYYTMPDRMGPFFLEVPEGGLDSVEFGELRTLRNIHHSRTKVASSLWSAEEVDVAVEAFRKRSAEDVRTETEVFDYYG